MAKNRVSLGDMPLEIFRMILVEVVLDNPEDKSREKRAVEILSLRAVNRELSYAILLPRLTNIGVFYREMVDAAVKYSLLDCIKWRHSLYRFPSMQQYFHKRLLSEPNDRQSFLNILQEVARKMEFYNPSGEDPDKAYKQNVWKIVRTMSKLWEEIKYVGRLSHKASKDSNFDKVCLVAVASYTNWPPPVFEKLLRDCYPAIAPGVLQTTDKILNRPYPTMSPSPWEIRIDIHQAAVAGGNRDILDVLLKEAMAWGHQDATITALEFAARRGDIGLVKWILEYHWKSDYDDYCYQVWNTPSEKIFRIFEDRFSRRRYARHFESLMGTALERCWTGVALLHLKKGRQHEMEVHSYYRRPVKNLFPFSKGKNWTNSWLRDACEYGLEEVVKKILSLGAVMDGGELYYAAKYGHLTVVKLLVAHGLHPKYGIRIAAQHDHTDVLEFLLESGRGEEGYWYRLSEEKFLYWIDVDKDNKPRLESSSDRHTFYHEHPLISALVHENKDMWTMLMNHGARLSDFRGGGFLAMQRAIDYMDFWNPKTLLHPFLGLIKAQAIAEGTVEVSEAVDEYYEIQKQVPAGKIYFGNRDYKDWEFFESGSLIRYRLEGCKDQRKGENVMGIRGAPGLDGVVEVRRRHNGEDAAP